MTVDDLRKIRWTAVKADLVYLPEAGIVQFWLDHPELGSPISEELPLDDGGVGQVFANGIVRWSADGGAALLK